ncbi:MAG: hypothetical protein AAGB35_10135, partial [Pseudomonadota bacterium]
AQLCQLSQLLASIQHKVAAKLSDDFYVFREKWLQLCSLSEAGRDYQSLVSSPHVCFLNEKPTPAMSQVMNG